MLPVFERPKMHDVVATRLKNHIVENDLKEGDRLPTEAELAKQFGISRLSLREATKSLEFLGVVESKPGRGLIVGQVNLKRVTEYLGFHPVWQNATPVQLIETRIVIETGVLPHVMRRMRKDLTIYDSLFEINSNLRQSKDLSQWVVGDIAFHRRLVESSGLAPLLAINDLLATFFQRFRESVRQAEWEQVADSHQRMIDHLRDGKLTRACRELREHIESHKVQSGTR
ncbi:GntR family transcriptional regulator [bacterium]|nr:GntR family transcriptional regulator [bacterium]